ncbi:MAG TPA: hypothetical protein VN696_13900 [Pyrinomonadaceae bacterium]|nr:hypothetical protein [Pyrinomonadaceae bacterium]
MPPTDPSTLPMAWIDPQNRTGTGGVDLLSNNLNFDLPLIGLSGRGLNLNLSLSYNSRIWTRAGGYVEFDAGNDSLSPGFRFNVPGLQGPYWNDQTNTYFYLFITPSGSKVELRYTGSGNTYESKDSSYIQLIDSGTSWLVRTSDGTQLSFTTTNGFVRCTQIKDRNGNYLTLTYTGGDISTITDTLNRVLTFNYNQPMPNEPYGDLISITQSWGSVTHTWATFGWTWKAIGFPPDDGIGMDVLSQVGLPDGTRYTFDYNNSTYGQVTAIHYYAADNHQRNYARYVYANSGTDCPRVSEQHEWAENWNGDYDDVPTTSEEAVTSFSHDTDGACRMTAPDGTIYKEYYGPSWKSGLTTGSEIWSGGVKQKWTDIVYEQDNTSVTYQTNPRVIETNIWDASYNHRRTTVSYTSYNLPNPTALPSEVKEYAANAVTVLRRTTKAYVTGQAYIDRHVLGLLREVIVYDQNNQAASKVWYDYDWSNDYWEATSQPATQHDSSSDPLGRGNLCWIGRWDVSDINNFDKSTRSYIKYNRAGLVIRAEDHYGHGNTISYADSFSDNTNRNTFAYPTTVTDADGFSSSVKYNYYFGAKTRVEGPPPQGQSQGAIQTMQYDDAARITRVTTENTGAYTRWDYAPYSYVSRFDTIQEGQGESYTITVWDGGGRVRAVGGSNPGSGGGYWGQFTIYDVMGRALQQTNPAEMNGGWAPVGDDAAGWVFGNPTEYDWKGRPKKVYNQDNTYKTFEYSGCGCAGGEVVTFTDEMNRQQKVYSDVLGRAWKTEVWTWPNPNNNNLRSIDSTIVSVYNARDQVQMANQYAGTAPSEASSTNAEVSCPTGTCQKTAMTFDGLGRLKTKHVPEQQADPNLPGSTDHTTWNYNSDDTIASATDARGATANYSYNNRHLVTGITYAVPQGSNIPASPNVTFAYDAAENRTSMTDSLGSQSYSYDSLSRLTSEVRYFSQLGRSYELDYGYNLGNQLATVAMPSWGQQLSYNHDALGRLNSVTATGYSSGYINGNWPNWSWYNQPVETFVSGITYRAWGAVKQMTYGNGVQLGMSYNTREQITHSEASNFYNQPNAGASYDYHADGKIHDVSRIEGHVFDRAYTYDHAGRVQDALTGTEASGGGTADGPYRENFGYDPFGNTVSQTTRLWSANPTTNATSVVNNRRGDSSYDANGFVTANYDGTLNYLHQYDASGKRSKLIPEVAWFNGQPAVEFNDSFDGNGLPDKRVDIRRETDPEFGGVYVTSNKTTYYLRSTALDNQVIADLDSQGNKAAQHIYMNGMQFANESPYNVVGQHTLISWSLNDPVTGTRAETEIHRYYTLVQELDPLGSDVTTPPPDPDPLTYQPPIYSVPEMPIAKLLTFDDAEAGIDLWYLNEVNKRQDAHMAALFASHGFIDKAQEILNRNPNVGIRIIEGTSGDSHHARHSVTLWGAAAAVALGVISRQDSDYLPLPNLRVGIQALLSKPDCANFVQSLINKVASKTQNPFVADYAVDLFDQINQEGGVRLQVVDPNDPDIGGTVSGTIWKESKGKWVPGGATITITPQPYDPQGWTSAKNLTPEGRRSYIYGYVIAALHETIHLAGLNGRYRDRQLAEAAHELDSNAFLPNNPNDRNANSLAWNGELKKHCPQP